jgi:type IV secretory pathway VirB10-like protein
MPFRSTLFLALLAGSLVGVSRAQDAPMPQLSPGTARKPHAAVQPVAPAPPQLVTLAVPKGTPLQVALDQEVRLTKVGQSIHGRIVESVYAFDQVVIPVGAEVTGHVTRIERVSRGKRTLAALDADFTPVRKVEITFDQLLLSDGRRLPLETTVTPGSGQVIQFVAASEKKKKNAIKDQASERTRQAKQQARQEWDNAMKQLKTPGRVHRVKRYVEAQLPVHRQFIQAGTVYFAELNQPLDFGSEALTSQMAEAIGGSLPPGAVVHAWLVTPLTSATAHKGDDVQAVLSRPLLDNEKHLILPQGSQLRGTVRQVQPARRMKKNGQLRIEFRELVPPDGVQQKVEATLEGVQAGKNANVKLDSEGGAEATTSKSRYLATGISLVRAAAAAHGDEDAHRGGDAGGDTGSRVAGGANGFKLVGMALGFAVRSRALGYTMGAYGAGVSIYSNFLARGHEVVFPKNTAMDVGVGTRKEGAEDTARVTGIAVARKN